MREQCIIWTFWRIWRAAPCGTLYAQTWNPAWDEYAGDSQGMVTLQMENGRRALYEGAKTNAVGLNG